LLLFQVKIVEAALGQPIPLQLKFNHPTKILVMPLPQAVYDKIIVNGDFVKDPRTQCTNELRSFVTFHPDFVRNFPYLVFTVC
jgi:hypothetical protein